MEIALREGQAAKLLNVSVKTLQAWRHRGGGPKFVKYGAAVRYMQLNLDEFIKERTQASTSDTRRRA